MLAYKAGQKVVTGLLRTVFRARVTGLEHFPSILPRLHYYLRYDAPPSSIPREGGVRKYTGYSRQSHEGFF